MFTYNIYIFKIAMDNFKDRIILISENVYR